MPTTPHETTDEALADPVPALSHAAIEPPCADEADLCEEESFLGRGLACASGRDGEVDLVAAHKWFSIAAARGCREALLHRAEIAAEMRAADIARAQRAARDHLRLN